MVRRPAVFIFEAVFFLIRLTIWPRLLLIIALRINLLFLFLAALLLQIQVFQPYYCLIMFDVIVDTHQWLRRLDLILADLAAIR